MEKDFTEAKNVLSALETYVRGKIEKKNQVATETPVAVQKMSLASQPELVSDHLVEESALPPLGVQSEIGTNGTSESINQSTAVEGNINSLNTQDDVVQNQPSTEVLGEQLNIPAGEGSSALENSSIQTAASIDTMTGDVSSSELESKIIPAEEIPAIADIPTLVPESTVMQGSIGTGEVQQQQPSENDLNVLQPIESNSNGVVGTPGEEVKVVETTANDSLTSTMAPLEASAIVNQPPQLEVAQFDAIPEVSIPGKEMNSEPASYQASTSDAQAYISDISQVASDTNVVMPTGTTMQEASDETLVVGPESFTPSR